MGAIIVGSGPSLRKYKKMPEDQTVICVNQSIAFVNRCDHWFTIDPTPINIRTMQENREGVTYWCATDRSVRLPNHVNRLPLVKENPKNQKERRFKGRFAKAGLDERFFHISTGNSAYGALNLAYHLGERKAVLIGVDATRESKLDGNRSRDLSHVPLLFSSAARQMDIASCGKLRSQDIIHMNFQEGLEWLRT